MICSLGVAQLPAGADRQRGAVILPGSLLQLEMETKLPARQADLNLALGRRDAYLVEIQALHSWGLVMFSSKTHAPVAIHCFWMVEPQ